MSYKANDYTGLLFLKELWKIKSLCFLQDDCFTQ